MVSILEGVVDKVNLVVDTNKPRKECDPISCSVNLTMTQNSGAETSFSMQGNFSNIADANLFSLSLCASTVQCKRLDERANDYQILVTSGRLSMNRYIASTL